MQTLWDVFGAESFDTRMLMLFVWNVLPIGRHKLRAKIEKNVSLFQHVRGLCQLYIEF